jgi:plastocyanin
MVSSLSLPALLLAQEPVPEPQAAASQPEVATAETETETEAEAARSSSSPAPASEAKKASASVEMRDYEFVPATVTIAVGDTVRWTNKGDEEHDADGNGIETGTLQPGDSGSQTFGMAGTYKYVCTFHPNMKGTVLVEASGGGGSDDPKADDGSVASTGAVPGSSNSVGPSSSGDGTGSSSSSLPSTGQNEIPLIVVGSALLCCGLLAGALWRYQTGP